MSLILVTYLINAVSLFATINLDYVLNLYSNICFKLLLKVQDKTNHLNIEELLLLIPQYIFCFLSFY